MKTKNFLSTLLAAFLFGTMGYTQDQAAINQKINKEMIGKKENMKTYVIEREIPDAGKLTAEQLAGISKKSNTVLAEIGPAIEWLHSYVTDNKVYCVYKAENETLLREHAEKGEFPINKISTLSTTIDPSTARN